MVLPDSATNKSIKYHLLYLIVWLRLGSRAVFDCLIGVLRLYIWLICKYLVWYKSLGACFWCCERLPDASCVALIFLYPVLYTVFAGKLIVADSAVAAVVVAKLGVVGVSSPGPGAYKLQGSEQLTTDSATFWL
jgi:hypothetical protein